MVVLQETWVIEEKEKDASKRLSNKFNWYFKSATKDKQIKKGRASGGQALGIKKELVDK